MADLDVFFATNRNRLPPGDDGRARFGDSAGPAVEGIAFGAAHVSGVTEDDPSSGNVDSVKIWNFGGIGPELGDLMLNDVEKDIWVFVHGTANTFTDSVQRAAYVCNVINATPGGRAVVPLVFSWPATGYQIANIAADLSDYRHDQAQAQASAADFVEFLQALYRFKAGIGQRRLTLLAHSMGNYMLCFGIGRWFSTPRPPTQLFDQVVLAAADEISTTFAAPDAGRLSDLWALAAKINVYASREDALMLISHIVNGDWRLGYDGPPNRADTAYFAPARYAFFDCTANRDFTQSFLSAPDRSHQYYRQSVSARADVARTLKGVPAPDGRRVYDQAANVYTIPVP